MARTLDMMKHKHAKHNWKYGCDCEFCTRKRQVTSKLNSILWNRDEWDHWPAWALFSSERHYLRKELKQLKEE